MRILVVTPDATGEQGGNRVTALRWARLLRALGHRVAVAAAFTAQRCDVLVALHARRSAPSILSFRRRRPRAPLVVALTGTDLYSDLGRSRTARAALEAATRLVVLQPLALRRLPVSQRAKARVILQSARPPARRGRPREDVFEVCQLAHLRAVKDPLRAGLAVRSLPAASRIVVTHAGAALDDALGRRARAEEARNRRYRWVGPVARGLALRLLSRSRVLVLSSRCEGGANVVSEAAACGVPVIGSRVDGTVGLLGPRYAGYFQPGDTRALRRLLLRTEADARFLDALRRGTRRLGRQVRPEMEAERWRRLLEGLATDAMLADPVPPARRRGAGA